MSADPRIRFMAAEMLESAVRSTEYLLRLDRRASSFDANLSKRDPLYNERLFEAFVSLIWLYSSGSTAYFEAVDVDPGWGRENLSLNYHMDVALYIAAEHRPLLVKLYECMGRGLARQMQRRVLTPELHEYAEQELDTSIALLRLLSPHTVIPSPAPGSEIIQDQPADQASTLPPASGSAGGIG